MALSVNNTTGPPDSIIATCTISPANLVLYDTKDLKELFLGHFASYGKIVRISVTTKNKSKVIHLQYSSAVEASNAKKSGNSFPGLNFSISLTTKHPNTQLLTYTPKARESPSSFAGVLTAPVRQPQIRTVDAYYQQHSNSQNSDPALAIRSSASAASSSQRLPVIKSSPCTPAASSSLNSSSHSGLTPNFGVGINSEAKEEKPNTCVKLELYQGPPASTPVVSSSSQAANSGLSSGPLGQLQTQSLVIRPPTRTLSQILNVDITAHGLKLIPRVNSSDALACQVFYGGKHPFPLAQMFGRSLGTMIMPTRSIMEGIKPGMKIDDSTLEVIWNSIEGRVINALVQKIAEQALFQESILKIMTPEWMDRIEDDVVNALVRKSAEKEIAAEETLMIIAEEAMDDLLTSVSQNMIESSAKHQMDMLRVVTESAEAFFLTLEEEVVSVLVEKIALDQLLTTLCEEVVDDLIECRYLQGHVRILGRKEIRKCRMERDSPLNSIPTLDSSAVIQRWLDEIPSASATEMPPDFPGALPEDSRERRDARNSSISAAGTSETARNDSPGLLGSLKRKLSFSNLFSLFKRRRFSED